MPSKRERLVKSYKENISVYEKLTKATEYLLSSIVERENIECAFPISARTKNILSFLEKVDRKGYKDPFADMTDITGLRIVLYSEDDISFMKDIIHERFSVDEKRSIDKKEYLGRNQFGYSGMNYVVSLRDDDPIVAEHAEFGERAFEIQLLTPCQLVWSEMQRKIEYKAEDLVSPMINRRLTMLCALFELAHLEFQYLLEKGIEELLGLPITLRSLRIYIDKSKNVKSVFSEALKNGVVDKALPEEDVRSLDELYEMCQFASLSSIQEIDSIVSDKKLADHLLKSIKKHAKNIRSGPTLFALLLLYHSDKGIDRQFLSKKKWPKDSIDFIVDRK